MKSASQDAGPRCRLKFASVALRAACLGTVASGATAFASAQPAARQHVKAHRAKGNKAASASCAPNAVKITFWAWVPGMNRAVSAFNATHPKICVALSDVGAGLTEFTKIDSALKAGTGAPDVFEDPYFELPSFVATHDLVNLAKYGANKIKSNFEPWVWHEVSSGSAVYGIPGDSGPMGLYYNSALFKKFGLSIPKTWTQFTSDAAKLHKADPSAYMTNFAAEDLQWMATLMEQSSAFPFKYRLGSTTVTIDWTGPKQMAFARYWQHLLSSKLVNATTDVSAQSFGDLDSGTDASWLSPAWGPSYFLPDAKKSLGVWRAAGIPQQRIGQNIQLDQGGSSYSVLTQSAHPAQAAEFAMWLNDTLRSWNILKTAPSLLFTTYKPLLAESAFRNVTTKLSGQTRPNVVFADANAHVTPVQYPPFMTYALAQAATVFGGVLNGKETLPSAFRSFQKLLVTYAKSEGFTVRT
jgi:multiple sugar transport system substrate-binding protein